MDLTVVDDLSPLANLVFLYICSDLKKRFLVLSNRKKEFAFYEQSHLLLRGEEAVINEDDVDSAVWSRGNLLRAALRFVDYQNLDHIALTISSNTLYAMYKDWTRFTQYVL